MNSRGMKIIGILMIGVCMTGCATRGGVVRSKERGKGMSKVYPIHADQAWEIAKTAFRWEHTDAVEEHRSEGYVLTSIGESPVTLGAVMGVWIEPVDKDRTRVTVVIKRKNPTEVLTTITEAAFHEDFEMAARIKAGRSFTPAPPAATSQSAPREGPTTPTGDTLSASTDIVTVAWTFANIRSGAGDDFSLVATVKRGDRLTVIGEDGDWLHVQLENGREGWIDGKKVR